MDKQESESPPRVAHTRLLNPTLDTVKAILSDASRLLWLLAKHIGLVIFWVVVVLIGALLWLSQVVITAATSSPSSSSCSSDTQEGTALNEKVVVPQFHADVNETLDPTVQETLSLQQQHHLGVPYNGTVDEKKGTEAFDPGDLVGAPGADTGDRSGDALLSQHHVSTEKTTRPYLDNRQKPPNLPVPITSYVHNHPNTNIPPQRVNVHVVEKPHDVVSSHKSKEESSQKRHWTRVTAYPIEQYASTCPYESERTTLMQEFGRTSDQPSPMQQRTLKPPSIQHEEVNTAQRLHQPKDSEHANMIHHTHIYHEIEPEMVLPQGTRFQKKLKQPLHKRMVARIKRVFKR